MIPIGQQKNSFGEKQSTISYKHDGLHRRMRRTVQNAAGTGKAKQRFLYRTNVTDPSIDEVVIGLDETLNVANTTLQEQHVFLNGPEIDQVFADQDSATSILWYLSDHQNTVRDVATMTYGATNNTANANANIPTVRNPSGI